MDDLVDYAIIGMTKLVLNELDYTQWSKEMLTEYGQQLQPFLRAIYALSKDMLEMTEDELDRLVEMVTKNEMNRDWKVSWNDISKHEDVLFGIFTSQDKNCWPEKAWSAIDNAGLNKYTNSIEKQRVLLMLLTLATQYNEFCDLAFDVYFDREGETFEWIQQGVINRFRLWEYIDTERECDINGFKDLDSYLTEITCDIIDDLRNEVFKALLVYYRNDYFGLFSDMLKTGYDRTEEEWKEWDENHSEFLDENENNAFYWITIGMPRSPRENV